jgi:transposase InsO family protein
VIACDFFTVETISLPLLRAVLYRARKPPRPPGRLHDRPDRCLGDPTGAQPQLHRLVRTDAVLIHDRDSKFTASFDEAFRSEGMKVIHTPIQAPQANAYAERFVRTVRRECLDWTLSLGRRHLERVLRIYATHYNRERPHRALALLSPDPADTAGARIVGGIERRDRLGGLIHEYHRAAA